MGLLNKLKGAVNAVTGGAAAVTIEYDRSTAFPGDTVEVKLTATAKSNDVKVKAVFVDLRSVEEISVGKKQSDKLDDNLNLENETFKQAFQIAPEFVLAAEETKIFVGQVQIPNVSPTYKGQNASHQLYLRGRLDARGNDPDSGYQEVIVGTR